MSSTNLGVERLIESLRRLREDFEANPDAWQNHSRGDYLEATAAWLEATKERAPEQPTWEYVAGVFGVGKIYE